MDSLIQLATGIGGLLLIALIAGLWKSEVRAEALATLIVGIPFATLLAYNNNHANALRNFCMGILMFCFPLLVHAALVARLRKSQSNRLSQPTGQKQPAAE
jgi:hypothetical protein